MTTKTRNVTGWVLTGLLALVFFGSAVGKFMVSGDNLKQAEQMGFTATGIKLLAILEIFCFLLFLIKRTGVAGSLLLAAYTGGIIATHVEHGMPVILPIIIETVVFITAFIRFPELTERLLGKASRQG